MHSVFSFIKYFHGERSLGWLMRTSFVLLLKVTVSGPFSPYEVKCYSMTKVSKFRYGNALSEAQTCSELFLLINWQNPSSLLLQIWTGFLIIENTKVVKPQLHSNTDYCFKKSSSFEDVLMP